MRDFVNEGFISNLTEPQHIDQFKVPGKFGDIVMLGQALRIQIVNCRCVLFLFFCFFFVKRRITVVVV